jgi:pimeloyl-ACP methyl ester carboxylesterase
MAGGFIEIHSSSFHYLVQGNGNLVVVLLHGYAEQATAFNWLQHPHYTFIAIDLPHHGHTNWVNEKDFTVQYLQQVINEIFKKENISPATFSLMGYSMGGRLALHFYESFPLLINKLFLVAPDGLKINPWYWFATQTKFGNRLFNYTMGNPYWFFNLMKLASNAKQLNISIYKFVHRFLDDEQARKNLYVRWTCMRFFKPSPKKIKQLVNIHQTPVKLIYGKYDRIISYKTGEQFCNEINKYCTLTVIDAGHELLHPKFESIYFKLLLNND